MLRWRMRLVATVAIVLVCLSAFGLTASAKEGPLVPDGGGEFQLRDTGAGSKDKTKPKDTSGKPSKLTPTKTEAALKFVVVDKDKGPVKGVVIALAGPTGDKFYTEETDADGYAEVLVPNGRKYELTYLSLGRKDVAASVNVTNEPNQTVKLTLRYKGLPPPPPFVLTGVTFDTGKATLGSASYDKLDIVVEFMKHKKSARIEISGHTDNAGNRKANKTLSAKRAQACRDYVVSRGIDKARLDAVGFGDERPIAPNDTEEGRSKNRRIEAKELEAPAK